MLNWFRNRRRKRDRVCDRSVLSRRSSGRVSRPAAGRRAPSRSLPSDGRDQHGSRAISSNPFRATPIQSPRTHVSPLPGRSDVRWQSLTNQIHDPAACHCQTEQSCCQPVSDKSLIHRFPSSVCRAVAPITAVICRQLLI